MKERIRLFISYWLFWYLLFIVARVAFLVYQFHASMQLSFSELAGTFLHGFTLDASMASYIMVIPALLCLLSCFFSFRLLPALLKAYTLVALLPATAIIIVDMVLYSYWGFRLDTTPLFYMDNPEAMTASVSVLVIVAGIAGILLVTYGIYRLFLLLLKRFRFPFARNIKASLVVAVLTGLVAIGIRGGVGIGAVSISWAYFSDNTFANHAAINPMWNVAFSLTEKDDLSRKYDILDKTTAATVCDSVFRSYGRLVPVLNQQRPNVILIIVESFTAKAIGTLGGIPGITPQFDSLTHEGVLFDHIYAASDRTDKGLAAVLAGYPSLPGSSPLKFPQKTDHLPSFPKYLADAGYNNSFYYGGSLDFANYRSFLVQAGFKKLITRDDFDASTFGTKWGAWDHLVFDRVLAETPDSDSGFFKSILTLTSHEPFAIPVPPMKKGNDKETLYLNSLHYTDGCLGKFIAECRKRPWWKNTLIIITADHGSIMPGHSDVDDPQKYRIPLLFLGGALSVKDTVIHTVAGQTDLARTLMAQMNLPDASFSFSKNILTTSPVPGAFYTYTGGLGYTDGKVLFSYNTISQQFSAGKGSGKTGEKTIPLSFLQHLYDDFSRR